MGFIKITEFHQVSDDRLGQIPNNHKVQKWGSGGKSMLTNLLSFHTHLKVNLLDKKANLLTILYREQQQCPVELDE